VRQKTAFHATGIIFAQEITNMGRKTRDSHPDWVRKFVAKFMRRHWPSIFEECMSGRPRLGKCIPPVKKVRRLLTFYILFLTYARYESGLPRKYFIKYCNSRVVRSVYMTRDMRLLVARALRVVQNDVGGVLKSMPSAVNSWTGEGFTKAWKDFGSVFWCAYKSGTKRFLLDMCALGVPLETLRKTYLY